MPRLYHARNNFIGIRTIQIPHWHFVYRRGMPRLYHARNNIIGNRTIQIPHWHFVYRRGIPRLYCPQQHHRYPHLQIPHWHFVCRRGMPRLYHARNNIIGNRTIQFRIGILFTDAACPVSTNNPTLFLQLPLFNLFFHLIILKSSLQSIQKRCIIISTGSTG